MPIKGKDILESNFKKSLKKLPNINKVQLIETHLKAKFVLNSHDDLNMV